MRTHIPFENFHKPEQGAYIFQSFEQDKAERTRSETLLHSLFWFVFAWIFQLVNCFSLAEVLTAAMRWRGTCAIRVFITKFEARITRCEGKAELAASDRRVIQCGVKTLKEYDADFKTNHFAVVKLANEQLEAEHVILDNNMGRVREFLDRLIQLLPELEKV